MFYRRALALTLGAALTLGSFTGPAAAQTPDGDGRQWLSQPAPREWVAEQIVTRNLHVPAEDLNDPRCWADHRRFTTTEYGADRAVFACYTRLLGFMEGTGKYRRGKPLFAPRRTITRAQFASTAVRVATQHDAVFPPEMRTGGFIDVPLSSVHSDNIRWAAWHGLVCGVKVRKGEASRFAPDAPVSRRQVLKVLRRIREHWETGKVRDC